MSKQKRKVLDSNAPWKPVEYELADAGALQALYRGDATKEQQQRALKYIIESIAGTYEFSYRPGGQDGDRDTAFALGRVFVGQQIVKLLKLNLSILRRNQP